MIAAGNEDEAKQLQQAWVHKIGNLTLTGFNSTLSNMSFENKKNRTKDGKHVGYKNGLYLNREICEKDRWTIDDIQIRTARLVEDAVELFKFEDE